MKKVFISVGMRGREDCDVTKDIDRAYRKIHNMFNGEVKDNDVDESVIFNDGKSFIIEKTIFKNQIKDKKS